ncbi:baseplate megatron protein TIM-barrel domain-containing protein [Methylorubrum rhodesianum]|uniref:baseplate megatron protein TIM-barrel domain-containing protein n=1 Tax=Methylorubrum rhodesianum TaxID=29427 RepID=UPI003D00B1B0
MTDGAHGKPWIYRAKDLVAWWSNPHVERQGGVETGPTAWVPKGKPIWLTEIGIPAVDRGTNGPNVFPDPKSSENARPPFSRGTRDDLIQARGLDAILSRFDVSSNDFEPGHNPVSPLYGGRMIPAEHIYVWAWGRHSTSRRPRPLRGVA